MELGNVPGRGSFVEPVPSLATPCHVAGNSSPHAADGILVQQRGVDSAGVGQTLGCAHRLDSSNDRDVAQTTAREGIFPCARSVSSKGTVHVVFETHEEGIQL